MLSQAAASNWYFDCKNGDHDKGGKVDLTLALLMVVTSMNDPNPVEPEALSNDVVKLTNLQTNP
jgi:hypothetical protein